MQHSMGRKHTSWVGRFWFALVAAAVAVAIVGGAFAFTAGNTVPGSRAGEGQGTISGYDVTSVHYTLNATNPMNIDSLSFALDQAPAPGSTIRVKLSTSGSWYTCTNVATAVTCATTSPQAAVASADNLTVVVAQ
jgi:hypothetical protein